MTRSAPTSQDKLRELDPNSKFRIPRLLELKRKHRRWSLLERSIDFRLLWLFEAWEKESVQKEMKGNGAVAMILKYWWVKSLHAHFMGLWGTEIAVISWNSWNSDNCTLLIIGSYWTILICCWFRSYVIINQGFWFSIYRLLPCRFPSFGQYNNS